MSEPVIAIVFGAGLLFALASALHCAGMCGAFALAAAGEGRARGPRFALYLAGKTCTYVFLGALAGAAGERLAVAFGPARVALGLLVGAVLLLAGARVLAGRGGAPRGGALGAVFVGLLAAPLARLRSAQQGGAWSAAFAVGALTGLLPCGVSWLAALQAAALGGPLRGAVFLLAFGLGTAPALATVGLLGGAALQRAGARRARWLGGGILLAAGVLAVARAGLAWSAGDVSACPACPPP